MCRRFSTPSRLFSCYRSLASPTRRYTWQDGQGKCKANTETVMLLYLFTILGGTSPSMTNVFIVCSCRTQYCLHWSGSNKLRGRAFNQVPNIFKSDHGRGLLLYLRMNIYFAIEISAKLNDRSVGHLFIFKIYVIPMCWLGVDTHKVPT